MIAANNGHDDGESGRDSAVPMPHSNGGNMGGNAPNVALNDRRVRAEARRLTALAEAGQLAAEKLPALVNRIEQLLKDKSLSARDVAALGGLQTAIASAASKGDTVNNFNGPTQINVTFVDDWYGSKAANTSAANGTPAKGSIKP